MKATLSILGMYEYDGTIFDEFVLPEQLHESREDFIYNLLMAVADFGCIYPNTTFLKKAIGTWSRQEVHSWSWLFETQNYDYNPIWNVDVHDSTRDDRNETRNLRGTNDETKDLHGTNNETRDLHGTNNETKNLAGSDTGTVNTQASGTDTETVKVNAFNDGAGTQKQQTTYQYGKGEMETRNLQSTNTGTDNYTSSDTGTDNYVSSDTGTDNYVSTDTGTIDHNDKTEFYKRGNQGVTTTQQMIREEQALAKFNIDDYIIDEFKKRFCIMLY